MISIFSTAQASRAYNTEPPSHVCITSPLSQYLNEAKTRSLYLLFSMGVTFLISYAFSMELVFLFVNPFLAFEKSFIFTELTEALYITIRVSIFVTLYSVFPLALYQVWCFVVPSLYRTERRRWGLFWVVSLFFLVMGLLAVYIVVLPKIAAVLLQFEIKREALTIQLEARISSYINWSFQVFFVAVILSQWPILSLIVYRLGLSSFGVGTKNRRTAFALSILIAAFVSPPDLLSQWVMAACLFMWFETITWLGMVQKRWYSE